MVEPPTVTERAGSTSLTSVWSLRCKTPSAITVGVKFRMMPNLFQLTVTAPRPVVIGIGNSPPTRNFASCPESATSVGSASILARPLDSSAVRIAENGNLGSPEKNRLNPPVTAGASIGGRAAVPVPGIAPNESIATDGATIPATKRPPGSWANRLIPAPATRCARPPRT